MENKNFYSVAHLVVAAIRIFEHQHHFPPSVDAVCNSLSLSPEQGNLICRKLHDIGIIEIVEGGYGTKIFIRDHLKIEEISKNTNIKSLQSEIEEFQSSRKDFKQQIESFQAQKAERQKQLFAELENKLKKKLDKK